MKAEITEARAQAAEREQKEPLTSVLIGINVGGLIFKHWKYFHNDPKNT